MTMIRKPSKDDEIPLTTPKTTILQETRARFDTLLKAALSQEDGVEKRTGRKGKTRKKSTSKSDMLKDMKPLKKLSKKSLSTSTQMLVGDDEHSAGSEQDVREPTKDKLFDSSPAEVGDSAPIPSLDDHQWSIEGDNLVKAQGNVNSNETTKQTELDVCSSSPRKSNASPQKRQSTRDESRETTSSRVSSPDSVMTAIEAASPSRSLVQTSPENGSLKGKKTEQYELKPLKAFSASYEEIDETSLGRNEQDLGEESFKGMENAASYEEILENPNNSSQKLESDSIQGLSYESIIRDRKSKQNKRTKLQLSFQKRSTKDENGFTDTSSNDGVHIESRQPRRHGPHFRKRSKSVAKNEIQSQPKMEFSYENIIGITIHRCDTLKIDSFIRHPMVRVHILDTTTGEYLKKSQPNRNVSYFQEHANIDYIQPVTSQPCNFKDPRSLTPIWEETLVFNEDIRHILQPQSSIVMLFEVLDCVSIDAAVAQYQKLGSESGWHKIAWAFLKPCGPNNALNIDKKLRLQLFKPGFEKTLRNHGVCDKCDVYKWWRKGGWIHYPSTLHVTVHSLPIPSDVTPAMRSYFALQPEQCSVSSNLSEDDVDKSLDRNINQEGMTSNRNLVDEVKWSRLPSQSCKVPNERTLSIPAGINGSFSLKFSHHGNHLALTSVTQNIHSIYVYRISDGTEFLRLQGHPGLVYSLDWSLNDDLLLSASADCTACIWSVKTQKHTPLQMLPHPSFVYCAVFLPTSGLSLATGCCDHVIRIWKQNIQSHSFELLQELNGHTGFVSTLCTNPNGNLFSGDSTGLIRIWQCSDDGNWSDMRVLNVRELQGVVLSHLVIHPGGKRLLVLARDSLLRMIDISTGVAIQWFKGALNHRIHSKACISPCGGLVFAPSEDGTFHVWNSDTGQLIASYSAIFHSVQNFDSQEFKGYRSETPTTILGGSVDYHPFDHVVGFAAYGIPAPVIVCTYNRESSGKDIGLQKQQASDEMLNVDSFTKSARLVSNLAAHIKSKKPHNPDHVRSNLTSGHDSTDGGQKKTPHLSYIIKQLDYVLQLGRVSKQEQKDVVLQEPPERSPRLSVNSSMQVGSSPTSSLYETRISRSPNVVKEAKEEVAYSVPHAVIVGEQQGGDTFETKVSKSQDDKKKFDSSEVVVTSPTRLQYVQEKQPPRPAPRQRRLKQLQLERRKSTADFSTSDTSIMSSDNEDFIKSVQRPVPAQMSHENEITNVNSFSKRPDIEVGTVRRVQAFSSFDSDSDIQLLKSN